MSDAHFIKLSSEVQDAAKWCAKRGYKGVQGDWLPKGLSTTAWEEIRDNPEAFKLAVHMSKSF